MEIRYPGLAPSPEQLKKLIDVGQGQIEEEEVPQFEIRQEDYPGGSAVGFNPTLGAEVSQLIYSVHWEHQKRILDYIESVISNDRQWTMVRKLLMNIMTEQVDKTKLLVSQKIRQELHKEPEEEINE